MSELRLENKEDGIWLIVTGKHHSAMISIVTASPMVKLAIQEAIESQDTLRAKIQSMLHEVQKYQPVGSPPPGDETMLVRWIMDTLRAENAKLREDITGYRRTVSKQHSDLARLRELLGEALERIPHWQRCAIFDNPEEQCDCGRSDIQYRIQSELKE